MTLTLVLFAVVTALELLVHIAARMRILRRSLAVAALVSGAFSVGVLLAVQFNLFSFIIAVLSLYRVFNMGRIVRELMHVHYLRITTRRTTLVLLGLQGMVALGWWAWNEWHVTGHGVWAVVGVVQLVIAVMLLVSVNRSLKKTIWPERTKHYSDAELPTVTVAIPARNETEDLQQCLQTVVACNYPKLEILVLDDCSQIKRTPEIIKGFAQAGVRFVQGHQPVDTWLPKNQAYDRLAHEASGQYILYCGVDVRFSPDSIRQIIATMLERNKQMLSILPRRQPTAYAHAPLLQAMQYWWELAPPRRYFKRPPVLSACWVIECQSLKKAGGFGAVARSIVPEAHFARHLIETDGYSFLRATNALGIESTKRAQDQRDTAVRMRYPQVHRRPEQVFLASFFEIFCMLLPFVLAIMGFWVSVGVVAQAMAGMAAVLLAIAYLRVTLSTRTGSGMFGLIGLPFGVITDVLLVHYSMWKYEFSTVEWKGRNICIPAMHVIPHLPKVE